MYVIKNANGLYWSKDNTYTPYVSSAKTYKYEDAVKAASRKNCRVFSTTCRFNEDYSFFIEEYKEIDI